MKKIAKQVFFLITFVFGTVAGILIFLAAISFISFVFAGTGSGDILVFCSKPVVFFTCLSLLIISFFTSKKALCVIAGWMR